jgi:RNA polymerase sigma-70 factor (ECF subfamily)
MASPDPNSKFEGLYDAHYESIHRYFIRRVANDLSEASDLAAEVFLTAWRRQDAIPAPPNDRLWLYGVSRHVLARHRRSTARRTRLSLRLATAVSSVPDSVSDTNDDRVERIRSAIAKLPRRERETLKLVLWDGLSHAEAGHLLGCSENAVGIRMHRARNRLNAALDVMTGARLTANHAPSYESSTCTALKDHQHSEENDD